MTYTPQPGDQAYLIAYGNVETDGRDLLLNTGQNVYSLVEDDPNVQIEFAGPAEPEWKTGDLAQDVNGVNYLRGRGNYWHALRGDRLSTIINDDDVPRPLYPLMPVVEMDESGTMGILGDLI